MLELLPELLEARGAGDCGEIAQRRGIHVPVVSSFIEAIDYRLDGTPTVNLANGRSYTYGGIPPNEVLAFLSASSKVNFTTQVSRDGERTTLRADHSGGENSES